MPMSTAMITAMLDLYFNNTNHANIGDATGLVASTADGNFYIGLHTATPGAGGDQTTNEATYTSYARVAVARTAAGWTISGTNVSNAAAVIFPTATGGSDTITHFSIGSAASGAGNLNWAGALDSSLAVSNLITPSFAIGELDVDGTAIA